MILSQAIDIFKGRTPKNVLANHYNPHGIEKLKKIYDKADLRVLASKPSSD
jgi:hypothetical protein